MNIWRIGGVVFMAGIALFLISVLAKVLIVAGLTLIALRVIGKQIARRFAGSGAQGYGGRNWQQATVISIDDPAYRTPMYQPAYSNAAYGRAAYGRAISIN